MKWCILERQITFCLPKTFAILYLSFFVSNFETSVPNFGTYIPNFGMCIPNFGIEIYSKGSTFFLKYQKNNEYIA